MVFEYHEKSKQITEKLKLIEHKLEVINYLKNRFGGFVLHLNWVQDGDTLADLFDKILNGIFLGKIRY